MSSFKVLCIETLFFFVVGQKASDNLLNQEADALF